MANNNIKEILKDSKTIAVVGLSSNPSRPSYDVSAYMQDNGYKIYPINPNENEVLGEKAYTTLKELPIKPDIVNVFRRSETVMPIVDECIELGIKNIWFQLGVVNYEAIEKAEKNNINVVYDKCILVEHSRNF
ncbi:MAG: CoA-binding protein [Candidatus Sericytochromatia bacterium]